MVSVVDAPWVGTGTVGPGSASGACEFVVTALGDGPAGLSTELTAKAVPAPRMARTAAMTAMRAIRAVRLRRAGGAGAAAGAASWSGSSVVQDWVRADVSVEADDGAPVGPFWDPPLSGGPPLTGPALPEPP